MAPVREESDGKENDSWHQESVRAYRGDDSVNISQDDEAIARFKNKSHGELRGHENANPVNQARESSPSSMQNALSRRRNKTERYQHVRANDDEAHAGILDHLIQEVAQPEVD